MNPLYGLYIWYSGYQEKPGDLRTPGFLAIHRLYIIE